MKLSEVTRFAVATAMFALLCFQGFPGSLATSLRLAAQTPPPVTTVNWPLHNLDVAGTRFSTMDQINRSNVKSLVPRWLFQHGVIDGVSNQTTPVIVDGT